MTELFEEMRVAGETSQQALCAAFLAHPLLALVLEQEGEEEATDFILAALIEYRQWATDSDDEAAALAWVESPQSRRITSPHPRRWRLPRTDAKQMSRGSPPTACFQ